MLSNWKYILLACVLVLGVGAELLKTDSTKQAAKKINNNGVLVKNIGFDMGYEEDIIIDPQDQVVIKENAVAKRLRDKAKNFKFKKKKNSGWTPDAARLSKADFKHGKKVKSKDKKKKRKKIAKKRKRVKRKTAKREKKPEQQPVAAAAPPKKETPTEPKSSNDNLAPASAVAQNNSNENKKKQLQDRTIDEWFDFVSEPSPSRTKVDDLVQHFQTSVVSDIVFYGVAKKMQESFDVRLHELSVRMFGAKATVQGFIGLATFSTSGSDFGSPVISEAAKYLKQFESLSNVDTLRQVLSSSTTDSIKIAAVRHARSSAETFLGSGEIPTTKENGKFENANAQVYANLLSALNSLSAVVDDINLQNEIQALQFELQNTYGISQKTQVS